MRATGVGLEAGESVAKARVELALEQDVADHAPFTGDGMVREEPDPGELGAGAVAVEATEELIAAANGQAGGAVLHRLRERAALGGEIGCDERLLAVLAASDVEEIVLPWSDRFAEPDRPVVELDPAPGGAALEDGDVAPVGVDVQVLRIEMGD